MDVGQKNLMQHTEKTNRIFIRPVYFGRDRIIFKEYDVTWWRHGPVGYLLKWKVGIVKGDSRIISRQWAAVSFYLQIRLSPLHLPSLCYQLETMLVIPFMEPGNRQWIELPVRLSRTSNGWDIYGSKEIGISSVVESLIAERVLQLSRRDLREH